MSASFFNDRRKSRMAKNGKVLDKILLLAHIILGMQRTTIIIIRI